MGRQIKGLLYFYIHDAMRSIFIFWTILVSTLTASMLIAFFIIDNPDVAMFFVLSFPAYIFCGIYGFLMVKHCIPFTIKMGATRKSLFLSTGIFILLLSIFKALLTSGLHGFVQFLKKQYAIQSIDFAHPATILSDTWLQRFVIDLAIMTLIFTTLFVIGLVFYRYGLIGGGALLAVMLVAFLFSFAKGWVTDYVMEQYRTISLGYFFQIIGISLIVFAISWFFIRRITIVKAD